MTNNNNIQVSAITWLSTTEDLRRDGYTLTACKDGYMASVYEDTKNIYVPFMHNGKFVMLTNTRPPQGQAMLDTNTGNVYVFTGKQWVQLVAT